MAEIPDAGGAGAACAGGGADGDGGGGAGARSALGWLAGWGGFAGELSAGGGGGAGGRLLGLPIGPGARRKQQGQLCECQGIDRL